MKKNLQFAKSFVRNLPGPKSYCFCEKICSPITIDHVLPKKLLKRGINYKQSIADPHNLYSCCKKLNKEKAALIFGQHFVLDNEKCVHTGALSRSCLYMYDEYKIPVSGKIVALWRMLHSNHEPQDFEFLRDDVIFEVFGTRNYYLDDYRFDVDGEWEFD